MPNKLSISRCEDGTLVIHPEGLNTIITWVRPNGAACRILVNQQPGGDFAINAVVLARSASC